MQKLKLKLLALPCTTSTTSTTSPSPPRLSSTNSHSNSNSNSSPCFNFRRGATLTTLLSRRFLLRGRNPAVDRATELSLMKGGLLTGHKLKDHFVCSPPHLVADVVSSDHSLIIKKSATTSTDGVNGFGSLMGRVDEYPVRRRRFGSLGLRYRLLRGAWRPRLGAIPE